MEMLSVTLKYNCFDSPCEVWYNRGPKADRKGNNEALILDLGLFTRDGGMAIFQLCTRLAIDATPGNDPGKLVCRASANISNPLLCPFGDCPTGVIVVYKTDLSPAGGFVSY